MAKPRTRFMRLFTRRAIPPAVVAVFLSVVLVVDRLDSLESFMGDVSRLSPVLRMLVTFLGTGFGLASVVIASAVALITAITIPEAQPVSRAMRKRNQHESWWREWPGMSGVGMGAITLAACAWLWSVYLPPAIPVAVNGVEIHVPPNQDHFPLEIEISTKDGTIRDVDVRVRFSILSYRDTEHFANNILVNAGETVESYIPQVERGKSGRVALRQPGFRIIGGEPLIIERAVAEVRAEFSLSNGDEFFVSTTTELSRDELNRVRWPIGVRDSGRVVRTTP